LGGVGRKATRVVEAVLCVLAVTSSLCVVPAHAQDGDDLAKQSQNRLGLRTTEGRFL